MKKSKLLVICILTIYYLLLITSPAKAMHLSEGILPIKYSALFYLLTLPFIIYGFLLIKKRKLENPLYFSMVGLIGATVFVISAFPIPVPIAGTCSHPAGTGLSSVILGPFQSVVVAFISLLIQALFMAHGGITTLGANVFTMGIGGSLAGYIAFNTARSLKLSVFWAGFMAGFFADIVTYFLTAFVIAVSIAPNFTQGLLEVSLAFVPTQVPLATLEGVITGLALRYIAQHRPEFLKLQLVKS